MASPQNRQILRLGSARVVPDGPVEAGAYVTIRLTYTADHPIDDTGYVMICFRQVSDFGRPQFSDPAAPNYCTVQSNGNCRVTPRWDPKGYTRPWGRALLLQIGHGYLNHGEAITVAFGDRSGGSPGWQMQTFAEHSFEFKVLVDPIATYQFKELPQSPALTVAAGPAARAVCIAPSQVAAGSPFSYHVKHEDRWGNPVGSPTRFRHAGFAAPGVCRLTVDDPVTGRRVASNPVEVTAHIAGQPIRTRWWADLHGQSEETVGTNTIDDYFRFGRDLALLDAVAHQGNDFQITDDFWSKVNDVSRKYNEPGRLVTFPGYEWSGNTPLGGDRNIYFLREGGDISHSCADLLPGKATAYSIAPTATELFAQLRRSEVPAFAYAHVGGRYADIGMHDPAVEFAVEIHSAWGTFEWLLTDALQLGHRVGVVANSDDHKCRPGASYPGAGEFGSLGGLTCLVADRLDRESLYAALAARHCYATTGNRPLLAVQLVTPDGRSAQMGDVVQCDGVPVLRVVVSGTAAIESVTVLNGQQVLAVKRPNEAADLGTRVKVVWRGAEVRGRARMTRWDGELRLEGNRITNVEPINFWNADSPLRRYGDDRVAWRSVTTGGLAGVIVDLAEPLDGTLTVKTSHGEFAVALASVGQEPQTVQYGGLAKQIEVYRLPAPERTALDFRFEMPLSALTQGDNPIYVRVAQEDGHLAWSSPIYVTRQD